MHSLGNDKTITQTKVDPYYQKSRPYPDFPNSYIIPRNIIILKNNIVARVELNATMEH